MQEPMLYTQPVSSLPTPIPVVPAALGNDAGLIGAAAWHRAFRPEAAGRP